MQKLEITKLTEQKLFQFMKEKESNYEAACKEFYRRYAIRTRAYIFKILYNKDDTDDIFQEAFLRFFKTMREKDEMQNIPAFLLRIARNLCLDNNKSSKRFVSVEDIVIPQEPENYEKDEMIALIDKALDLLDERQKEFFVLREYQRLSFREIGELKGTNEQAAKSVVFRAKIKIREILQPYIKEISELNRS